MRPTNLGFRSPKEKTGEFYNPQVTSDGRRLNFDPKSYRRTDTDFNAEPRFEGLAKKIRKQSVMVGPGSYE